MVNDGADRNSRIKQLLRLSDELKELSDQVQRAAMNGTPIPGDLLARNHELVRRCDEFASEMS